MARAIGPVSSAPRQTELAGELVSCYCLRCGSKIGRFENVWDQPSAHFYSPKSLAHYQTITQGEHIISGHSNTVLDGWYACILITWSRLVTEADFLHL